MYIQGASNADACVQCGQCGLPQREHPDEVPHQLQAQDQMIVAGDARGTRRPSDSRSAESGAKPVLSLQDIFGNQ